ncbi:MAG: glycosyltransferase family 32 protein [Enterococcus sp.]
MIPKTIHYCWFGGNPLPENVEKCIASWRKFCPAYEIIEWNESNYDVNKHPYMAEAYHQGKFAFVSDYARLDIVHEFGGIYLDTDVELIKSLDSLRTEECYMGLELPGKVNTGIGFGAKKHSEVIRLNLAAYDGVHFINQETGKANQTTCVDYTSRVLQNLGLTQADETQWLKNITIYNTSYFCPLNMETKKLQLAAETISIHHYDASWYSQNQFVRQLNKWLLPIKIKARKRINQLFGENAYEKVKARLR